MITSAALRRAVALFLPAAVLATFAAGLGYTLVQQDLRGSANDPQEQLAADGAAKLDAGAQPASVVGPAVDAGSSLAPFVIVFDTSGRVLASSGQLNGAPPMPPQGVLDAARSSGRNAVTWQPSNGVRLATVVVRWQGGTVLAARSLRLVEQREANAELIAGLAWAAALVVLAAACLTAALLWPARDPAAA